MGTSKRTKKHRNKILNQVIYDEKRIDKVIESVEKHMQERNDKEENNK